MRLECLKATYIDTSVLLVQEAPKALAACNFAEIMRGILLAIRYCDVTHHDVRAV